jgi:hypothetical protein
MSSDQAAETVEVPIASTSRRASLHIGSGVCSETTTMKGDELSGTVAFPLSHSATTLSHPNLKSHHHITPSIPTSSSPMSSYPSEPSASVSPSPPTRMLHCVATPTPHVPPMVSKDTQIDLGNIEFTPVENDPRTWSSRRKVQHPSIAISLMAAIPSISGVLREC